MATTLLSLGALLLLGLLAETLGRHTPLPRVTLLLLFGVAVGSSGLDLLPLDEDWFTIVAPLALVMVGFLLGGRLTLENLRRSGRAVLAISMTDTLVTAVLVTSGLVLLGTPFPLALLFGGIAPATAPAASADVVKETRADGPFTRTLLGVVAIDDAWGLMTFSLLLGIALTLSGAGSASDALALGLWELGGAVLVGTVLGLLVALMSGRLRAGEPTLVEALAAVCLCCGGAMYLEVSYLLAAMVMGCTVANTARHHTRPFHAIEDIDWPVMILFFTLAGASLHVDKLASVGTLGVAYIVLRVCGRLLGAGTGAALAGVNGTYRRTMGLALLPQAGVALGMALVAAEKLPEYGHEVLSVTIAATVLFEVTGPVLTRWALVRAGEVPGN